VEATAGAPSDGLPPTPTLAGPGAGGGTPGGENGTPGSGGETSEPGTTETAATVAGNGGGACAAGANLLTNPGFEEPYVKFGGIDEINHAQGWFPWFSDTGGNLRPEYKPADGSLFPNRVVAGRFAQQYFKSFGIFRAGLYQLVEGVPAGCPVQFSAYAQAWSCQPDSGSCPGDVSINPANTFMRVGIHPDGGAGDAFDPLSGAIVWSPYANPLDAWQQLSVSTVAQGSSVVVFLWASPNQPRLNQDAYWDEAELRVSP
jgi:hypothetical protein